MKKKQFILSLVIIVTPLVLGSLILSINGKNNTDPLINQSKKLGVVEIVDIILTSDEYVRQLQEFRKDNTISGVILRIDSPGGAVAPSQEIYEEVMRFRTDKKPIIISMGNIAASGGYYIASAGTKIFASPGTITGSIGVIMQMPQYDKLLDKIGFQVNTIKSGEFKDVGNPNRALTDKERSYLQDFIDTQYDQFIKDVSVGRNMSIQKMKTLAEGKIYTGNQAKEIGLIDSIGGYTVAIDYCKKLLNLPEKTKLVEKSKYSSLLSEVFSESFIKMFPFLRVSTMPAGAYFLLSSLGM